MRAEDRSGLRVNVRSRRGSLRHSRPSSQIMNAYAASKNRQPLPDRRRIAFSTNKLIASSGRPAKLECSPAPYTRRRSWGRAQSLCCASSIAWSCCFFRNRRRQEKCDRREVGSKVCACWASSKGLLPASHRRGPRQRSNRAYTFDPRTDVCHVNLGSSAPRAFSKHLPCLGVHRLREPEVIFPAAAA